MAHKADHERLLQDAGDFVDSLGVALKEEDSSAIAGYFYYWLSRHMADRDRKLSDFANGGHGASTS